VLSYFKINFKGKYMKDFQI